MAAAYRFTRTPIVVFTGADPAPKANINFYVFARLNRALPRGRAGVRADLRLDGSPSEAGIATASRHPPCYRASYGNHNNAQGAPQLVHPKDGQRATLTLYFNKRRFVRTRIRLRHVDAAGYDPVDARYLRRLGCTP